MDSIWVILSLSSWYYCVNLSHNVIIIMILLFLFGTRGYYHHDIIGAQWGNLMIPLYDIIVFLFLGGFFPAGDLEVVVPVVAVQGVVVGGNYRQIKGNLALVPHPFQWPLCRSGGLGILPLSRNDWLGRSNKRFHKESMGFDVEKI